MDKRTWIHTLAWLAAALAAVLLALMTPDEALIERQVRVAAEVSSG